MQANSALTITSASHTGPHKWCRCRSLTLAVVASVSVDAFAAVLARRRRRAGLGRADSAVQTRLTAAVRVCSNTPARII